MIKATINNWSRNRRTALTAVNIMASANNYGGGSVALQLSRPRSTDPDGPNETCTIEMCLFEAETLVKALSDRCAWIREQQRKTLTESEA